MVVRAREDNGNNSERMNDHLFLIKPRSPWPLSDKADAITFSCSTLKESNATKSAKRKTRDNECSSIRETRGGPSKGRGKMKGKTIKGRERCQIDKEDRCSGGR